MYSKFIIFINQKKFKCQNKRRTPNGTKINNKEITIKKDLNFFTNNKIDEDRKRQFDRSQNIKEKNMLIKT